MIGKNKICRFNPLAANPPLVLGVSPSKKQMGMKPKKAMLHVVYMQHCKLQCCDWTRSACPLLLDVNFKACTKNRQNQHKSNRIHKSAKTNTKKGQSQHKSTTILKTLKSDKTDTKKGQSQHKSTTILYNIKK